MKNSHFASPIVAGCVLAFALNPFFTAGAADKPGSPSRIISSKKQAESVPRDAQLAMACSKCQTILVRDVDEAESFLEWFTPGKKHACPTCKGEWQMKPSPGKKSGKSRTYSHTCSKCGDDSVFCCSTPPRKTSGMKKPPGKGSAKGK